MRDDARRSWLGADDACCAVALSLLLSPSAARAEPHPSEAMPSLSWTVPEGCPKASELVARAHSLLADGDPRASVPTLEMQAKVEQLAPEQWALTMTWRQEGGSASTRHVSAKTCDELTDAAALLVALAIDPTLSPPEPTTPSDSEESGPALLMDGGTTNPPPEPGQPPARGEVVTVAAAPQARREADSTPERFRLGAGAGVTVVAGWLPRVTPGLALLGSGARGPWSATMELGYFLPRHETLPQADAGGDFWLGRAALTAAYAFDVGAVLIVAPAIGASLNVLYGTGTGIQAAQHGYTTAAAFVAGVRFRRAIASGFGLSVSVDGMVAAARPSFSIGNGGEVFKPDLLGLHTGLAAEIDVY